MAFSRTLLGWAVVAAFFLLWSEVARRLSRTPGHTFPSLKASLLPLAVEAFLLTLFAGLWFTSLGSGGATLLFAVVGALMEIPSRLKGHAGVLPWRPVLGGIVRIVIAGTLLGLLLG